LEWNVIYVGSSESSDYDQPLEEVLVGPVTAGCHKFVLQADAPNPQLIPHSPLGITVVLITCSYQQHEFVRIGYYVNNEYPISITNDDDNSNNNNMEGAHEVEEEVENEQLMQPRVLMPMHDDEDDDSTCMDDVASPSTPPPPQICSSSIMMDLTKIVRTTLADKPRVTRFAIPWDEAEEPIEVMPVATTSNMQEEDEYRRVVSPTNDMMMTAEQMVL
jgi:hypothetical protein